MEGREPTVQPWPGVVGELLVGRIKFSQGGGGDEPGKGVGQLQYRVSLKAAGQLSLQGMIDRISVVSDDVQVLPKALPKGRRPACRELSCGWRANSKRLASGTCMTLVKESK